MSRASYLICHASNVLALCLLHASSIVSHALYLYHIYIIWILYLYYIALYHDERVSMRQLGGIAEEGDRTNQTIFTPLSLYTRPPNHYI